MFRTKKSTSISSSIFSPSTARLWQVENNQPCLYLLNTNYNDEIERRCQLKGQQYQFSLYNKSKRETVKVLAVKQVEDSRSLQFTAATLTSRVAANFKTTTQHGTWQPIDNPREFNGYHQQHRLLYVMKKLFNSPSVQKLVKQCTRLSKETNVYATAKRKAIETLLQAIENNNFETFIGILDQPSNNIYKAMIKPRPHVWQFGCFFIDFTASLAQKTTTWTILAEIKQSKELAAVRRELAIVGSEMVLAKEQSEISPHSTY